jgi:hypothetical protein
MATDYDAPRNPVPAGQDDETISDLKTRRTERRSGATDIGEPEATAAGYLGGLDVVDETGDELTVAIHPKQVDEFRCSRCFLVQHRSRFASTRGGPKICRDCRA